MNFEAVTVWLVLAYGVQCLGSDINDQAALSDELPKTIKEKLMKTDQPKSEPPESKQVLTRLDLPGDGSTKIDDSMAGSKFTTISYLTRAHRTQAAVESTRLSAGTRPAKDSGNVDKCRVEPLGDNNGPSDEFWPLKKKTLAGRKTMPITAPTWVFNMNTPGHCQSAVPATTGKGCRSSTTTTTNAPTTKATTLCTATTSATTTCTRKATTTATTTCATTTTTVAATTTSPVVCTTPATTTKSTTLKTPVCVSLDTARSTSSTVSNCASSTVSTTCAVPPIVFQLSSPTSTLAVAKTKDAESLTVKPTNQVPAVVSKASSQSTTNTAFETKTSHENVQSLLFSIKPTGEVPTVAVSRTINAPSSTQVVFNCIPLSSTTSPLSWALARFHPPCPTKTTGGSDNISNMYNKRLHSNSAVKCKATINRQTRAVVPSSTTMLRRGLRSELAPADCVKSAGPTSRTVAENYPTAVYGTTRYLKDESSTFIKPVMSRRKRSKKLVKY
ncbi:uncharacterized protein LOC126833123 [Adelges cooleyi]|uniref:uncharacterized protein LOC126833123 n=1 Tax=Adelges cooleyi TaxID=133065 RepID=UPI002180816A|nr:uncharacterized protein LOC126833123 [Adelges cooleyi]